MTVGTTTAQDVRFNILPEDVSPAPKVADNTDANSARPIVRGNFRSLKDRVGRCLAENSLVEKIKACVAREGAIPCYITCLHLTSI
jgi:hypothetical protein